MRILALLLLLALPAAADDDPAALLVWLQGPARSLQLPATGGTLQQATSTRLLGLEPLPPGAFVQLAPNASARLVYYGDGHEEQLTGPCVIRVGRDGGHLVKGNAITVVESDVGELLRPPDMEVERTQALPGTDLALGESGGNPIFTWATQARPPYVLSVWQGQRRIWSAELSGTSVPYTGPALTRDTPYTAQLTSGSTVLATDRFELFSPPVAAALAVTPPTDPAGLALLSLVYDQRGESAQAVQLAQKALDQQQNVGFMRRLSGMLGEMGDEARAQAMSGQAKLYEDSFAPMFDPNQNGMDGYLGGLDTIYAGP